MAVKRKPDTIWLRVEKGALVPADRYSQGKLRERGYCKGDVLSATLKKVNNPAFNRLHHRIGQLCVQNIEAFQGMDAHKALKKIQWEANIACEEMPVLVDGKIAAVMRFPLSLSFENMDDGERHEVVRAMCRWISNTYWPELSPEQVEEMADSFVEEV